MDGPALVRRRVPDRSPTASTSRPRRPVRSRRPTSSGSLFVGRPEERKGLPGPVDRLRGAGSPPPLPADRDRRRRSRTCSRYLADPDVAQHIEPLGRISGDELWRRLHEADVLCAPSLEGESFGMVLIEAFAAGTPVIASAIAGYADVVTDGVDGVLVPPADPQRLAEELQSASPRARAPGGDGRGRTRLGAALRVAARRRRGRRGLRGRAGSARAHRGDRAPRSPRRAGAGRRRAAPTAAAAPVARSGARAAGGRRHRVARRIGLGLAGRPRGRADGARRATGSGSTAWSPASSAPTRPGCWSRPP